MDKKDLDLLMTDICSRIPYGVKFPYLNWDEELCEEKEVAATVYAVNKDNKVYMVEYDGYVELDEALPYLRPLSSMTDAEREEFSHVALNHILTDNSYELLATRVHLMVDWLLKHHLDIRNLIGLGLATEAPEGLYDVNG